MYYSIIHKFFNINIQHIKNYFIKLYWDYFSTYRLHSGNLSDVLLYFSYCIFQKLY